MQVILVVIPALSLIFAAFGGRVGELSAAMLEKSGEAVELVISLCGIICFWSGIMRVAERAGLVEKLARLLSPIVAFLFKGVKRGGKAAGLITMNLAANILGLGNASTPLGIAAMKALRAANGAAKPFDILPCVWMVSAYSAVLVVAAVKLMCRIRSARE